MVDKHYQILIIEISYKKKEPPLMWFFLQYQIDYSYSRIRERWFTNSIYCL